MALEWFVVGGGASVLSTGGGGFSAFLSREKGNVGLGISSVAKKEKHATFSHHTTHCNLDTRSLLNSGT